MNKNDVWNIINTNLKKYLKQRDSLQEEIISYVKKLALIIVEEYPSYKQNNFKMFALDVQYEFQDLNDTFKIVSDFFKEIDLDLYESFLNIIYDDEITKISCNSTLNGVIQDKLFLSFSQNSSDAYVLCHEAIHKIFNQKKDIKEINKSYVMQMLFDEVNSITFEKIFNDKNDVDFNKFMNERLQSDLSKSILFLFVEWILEVFIKNNENISEKIIKKELDIFNNKMLKNIFGIKINYLLNMVYKDELYRQVVMAKYIIGSTISTSIYKKIKKEEWDYKLYFRKINLINDIKNFKEGLNILELNYLANDDILSEIQKNYHSFYQKMYESRKR